MNRITRAAALLALTAVPAIGIVGSAAQAGAITPSHPTVPAAAVAKAKTGTGTASANLVFQLPSFAYSLCGDAAFDDGSEPGSVHIVLKYNDGAGPFGGGSYDCATGELTI